MALVDADSDFALCRDLALLAVRQDGMVLQHLWSWEQDDEVALAAVRQNGWALQFASGTPEVILAAVQQNGMALRILLDRNDERANEFALAAVSSCGMVLQYLDAEMRRSEQIVRAAIKHSRGRALEWASRTLKGDKAIVLEAVTLHDRSLQFATPELRADGAFMAAAAARNPRVAYDAEQAEAALANVQKRRQQWRTGNGPVTKAIKRWNDTGEKLKRQRNETFHFHFLSSAVRDRPPSSTQISGATAKSAALPPLAPRACPTQGRHRHPEARRVNVTFSVIFGGHFCHFRCMARRDNIRHWGVETFVRRCIMRCAARAVPNARRFSPGAAEAEFSA